MYWNENDVPDPARAFWLIETWDVLKSVYSAIPFAPAID